MGKSIMRDGVHSSHKMRYSDSSLYDEICTKCGITDATTESCRKLAEVCTAAANAIPGSEEEIRVTRTKTASLIAKLVTMRDEESMHGAQDTLQAAIDKLTLFDEMTVQLLHRSCACCYKWNKEKRELTYQCGRCKILEMINAENSKAT